MEHPSRGTSTYRWAAAVSPARRVQAAAAGAALLRAVPEVFLVVGSHTGEPEAPQLSSEPQPGSCCPQTRGTAKAALAVGSVEERLSRGAALPGPGHC